MAHPGVGLTKSLVSLSFKDYQVGSRRTGWVGGKCQMIEGLVGGRPAKELG